MLWGIFSNPFSVCCGFLMIQKEVQLHQIDLTPPYVQIFDPPLLIDGCRGSNTGKGILKLGTDIPPGPPLPVEALNQLSRIPLMPLLHSIVKIPSEPIIIPD